MADNSNEVKIKITGDSKGAEGAFSRVVARLNSVRAAVGNVMKALGTFGMAWSGIETVVGWFKSLREWINRAETAARSLQEALRSDAVATSAALAAKAYKDLNKKLAEANRLEKERNDILDRRKATARDLEDAGAELAREREIAALDPASATYEEDKAAIARKYARAASRTAASRAKEDAKDESARLYSEADRKDRQANEMAKVYKRQWRAQDRQNDIVRELGFAVRRGEDGAQEKYDKAENEWKAMYDAAKATEEAMETLRKEAASLRSRAGELAGGGYGASIRDQAAQTRLDNEEREAQAKKDAAAKAEAERAAEAKRKEGEAKRSEEERAAAAQKREVDARGRAMASGMAGADAVSSNRLTAMGLGSGVTAHGGVADNVKRIVALLKEEIAATKGIKAEGFGPAVYSE